MRTVNQLITLLGHSSDSIYQGHKLKNYLATHTKEKSPCIFHIYYMIKQNSHSQFIIVLVFSHILVRSYLRKFKSHKIMHESNKIMCLLQFCPLKNCNHSVVPNHCYQFLFIYIFSTGLIKTLSNTVSRIFHGCVALKTSF